MGAVWVAYHLGLQSHVVVKFMAEELAATEEGKSRFSKEAAATAQVRSPHVVQTLDYGVTDDKVPYLVMELLEGHDLGREIDRCRKLQPSTVVAIVIQLARALSRVHERGIVHRDIKPNNIFLCDVGGGEIFVKLLDFGVAKTHGAMGLGNTTNTGTMLGTPYYMSPEQIMGAKEIDPRSDLWSVGVVVYEALTGRKPFEGETVGGLAVRIMRDPLPMPSKLEASLPASLDAWFAKACAREPADRFQNARELSDGLAAAFAMPDSLSGSQPRFAPAVAFSDHPPATTGEAFAPTALDASTPGIREGISREATLQSGQSVAKRKANLAFLAAGLALVGLLMGFGVLHWLDNSSDSVTIGLVSESASFVVRVGDPPVTTGEAVASVGEPSVPVVPTASAASSAPDPGVPVGNVSGTKPFAKPTSVVKPTADKPSAPATAAPPAPPTPARSDDIW
jgi:serine/threonine-protein kinase